jgi:hypothetical protein
LAGRRRPLLRATADAAACSAGPCCIRRWPRPATVRRYFCASEAATSSWPPELVLLVGAASSIFLVACCIHQVSVPLTLQIALVY